MHKFIAILGIFSVLGNCVIKYNQKTEQNFYKDADNVYVKALILDDGNTKKYSTVYNIRLLDGNYKGKKLLLNVKKNNKKLKAGYIVSLQSTYQKPEGARNSGGFDYDKYLKNKGISGILSCTDYQINIEKQSNNLFTSIYRIRQHIVQILNEHLSDSNFGLMVGLLMGDKTYIEDEVKENFTHSSLAHILAVSGAHISYIILGIQFILKRINLDKRITYIIAIALLLCFSSIVGASPSVLRATIMAIMILVSKLLKEKADIYTGLAFSLLVILLNNSYAILDIGLQLSYLATLGIILFHRIFLSILNIKSKKLKKIKELISISLSAQILILPLISIYFHNLPIHFIVSSVIATPLFAIAVLYGCVCLIVCCINSNLGDILMRFLEFDLLLLNGTAQIMGQNSWGNILVTKPEILEIVMYYSICLIFLVIYRIAHNKSTWTELTCFEKKQQILLRKLIKNKKRLIRFGVIILIIVMIFKLVFNSVPGELEVHFIDVGQGDSTLIKTPYHKNILIDGGGSTDKKTYDVGKRILIPYLLNGGIKSIDYILISHFDSDHVRTEF